MVECKHTRTIYTFLYCASLQMYLVRLVHLVGATKLSYSFLVPNTCYCHVHFALKMILITPKHG
jgi:hypothetical protein